MSGERPVGWKHLGRRETGRWAVQDLIRSGSGSMQSARAGIHLLHVLNERVRDAAPLQNQLCEPPTHMR